MKYTKYGQIVTERVGVVSESTQKNLLYQGFWHKKSTITSILFVQNYSAFVEFVVNMDTGSKPMLPKVDNNREALRWHLHIILSIHLLKRQSENQNYILNISLDNKKGLFHTIFLNTHCDIVRISHQST